MEFIIVIVIIGVIVFFVKTQADKAKAERLERERVERQQKAATVAKAKKAKFEVITEAEKQKLASRGVLDVTLNAFNKAVKGDAKSMLFMGITYQQIQVENKSFYWMEKSSNAGNSDALYWLGEFYVGGYGVQANRTKGVGMVILAAKKGNKLAIQSLKENGMSVEEMRSCGIPV